MRQEASEEAIGDYGLSSGAPIASFLSPTRNNKEAADLHSIVSDSNLTSQQNQQSLAPSCHHPDIKMFADDVSEAIK